MTIESVPSAEMVGTAAVDLRFCTIAARNYLATTVLLARSLRRHHPTIPISVLVVDGDELDRRAGLPFEVVLPGDLPLEPGQFGRMATYYEVTELCTALKPYFVGCLLEAGAEAVIYLDPDIEVLAPLDDLFTAAVQHGIVLTPHVLQPVPRDGLLVDEEAFLRSGQFNLGFIGIGRDARPFLDYWAERTRLFALVDCDRGYFTDQRWVDAVPSLFDHVVVRDPGCNVAYWNLHERALALDGDDGWTVNGRPVRFFHFSGHEAAEPFRLSRHLLDKPRVRVEESAPLRRLLYERSERMKAVETTIGPAPPYGFDRTEGGMLLAPWIRRVYWDGVRAAEETGAGAPPHAFESDGGEGFLAWLCSPPAPGTTVPRHLVAYWAARHDLRQAFPEPLGADGPALNAWAAMDAGYAQAMPIALRHTEGTPPGATGKGVNLVGYYAGQFGVGEAGRLVARMVRAAGVPTAVTTLYPPGQTHVSYRPAELNGALFDVSVLSLNADGLLGFATSPDFAAHGGRRVGAWYWEVGPLPPSMRAAFDVVDEVWCASEHVRSLLAPLNDRPVIRHPVVIDVPAASTALLRSDLGLPDDRFLFGFAFDYTSVAKRKNPLGVIDAYCRAFGPGDGATLVLKTLNAEHRPTAAATVRHAADRRPDIVVLDRHLTTIEIRAFFQLLDCYVSLHRAEGLGLTIAAAMAAGIPCVATGWSGNLEFMSADNSMLVPFDLVEVGDDAGPYAPDAWWAEPDVAAAANAMRTLFDDRVWATALGARGRASIRSEHSAAAAATWFLERLSSLSPARVAA